MSCTLYTARTYGNGIVRARVARINIELHVHPFIWIWLHVLRLSNVIYSFLLSIGDVGIEDLRGLESMEPYITPQI